MNLNMQLPYLTLPSHAWLDEDNSSFSQDQNQMHPGTPDTESWANCPGSDVKQIHQSKMWLIIVWYCGIFTSFVFFFLKKTNKTIKTMTSFRWVMIKIISKMVTILFALKMWITLVYFNETLQQLWISGTGNKLKTLERSRTLSLNIYVPMIDVHFYESHCPWGSVPKGDQYNKPVFKQYSV